MDEVSFDKLRSLILEHGVADIKNSIDSKSLTFILNNGEVFILSTQFVEVPLINGYGEQIDTIFEQSDILIYRQVEP